MSLSHLLIAISFKYFKILIIIGHNLNLVVSHALDSKSVEGSGNLAAVCRHSAVIELVQICKEIVTRVKRTQMQTQLDTTLKQVRR